MEYHGSNIPLAYHFTCLSAAVLQYGTLHGYFLYPGFTSCDIPVAALFYFSLVRLEPAENLNTRIGILFILLPILLVMMFALPLKMDRMQTGSENTQQDRQVTVWRADLISCQRKKGLATLHGIYC